VLLFAIGLAAVVAREANAIVRQLPSYIDKLNAFTRDNLGSAFISASQRAQAADATAHIDNYLREHTADIIGGIASLLSGIFTLFTVGLFTYYLTAYGPNVRRALLSRVPPRRQKRVLFAWETAIRKVGG
jgi:predicted PurR-regulated permease PerM